MNQGWNEWIPSEDIYSRMIIMKATVLEKRLLLTFEKEDQDQIVTVHFQDGFLSLRMSDEFSYEKSTDELNAFFREQQRRKFDAWFLFTVDNSSFIESFQKETGGLYSKDTITHYVIFADDKISEILASHPPKITVSNLPSSDKDLQYE